MYLPGHDVSHLNTAPHITLCAFILTSEVNKQHHSWRNWTDKKLTGIFINKHGHEEDT